MKKYEKEAIAAYEAYTNVKVVTCGAVISKLNP